MRHAHEEAGITGVPAFEIGGRLLTGMQDRETFEAALAATSPRPPVAEAGQACGPDGCEVRPGGQDPSRDAGEMPRGPDPALPAPIDFPL